MFLNTVIISQEKNCMKNINADTGMREAISGTGKSETTKPPQDNK